MKLIVKEPNKNPIIIDSKCNAYEFLKTVFKDKSFDCNQEYSYCKGFDIYVNDIGFLEDKFNFNTNKQPIYGIAVFLGYDGNEDNIGLNKSQIQFIKRTFK